MNFLKINRKSYSINKKMITKTVFLSLTIIASMMLMSNSNQIGNYEETIATTSYEVKEISFGVRGNCGMCKKTIEKAALSVQGVETAKWDKEKKKIDVTYDAARTNEMAIHKAIAASGYDTDKVKGSDDAYEDLPGCCKYDHEMEMNQSSSNN